MGGVIRINVQVATDQHQQHALSTSGTTLFNFVFKIESLASGRTQLGKRVNTYSR